MYSNAPENIFEPIINFAEHESLSKIKFEVLENIY